MVEVEAEVHWGHDDEHLEEGRREEGAVEKFSCETHCDTRDWTEIDCETRDTCWGPEVDTWKWFSCGLVVVDWSLTLIWVFGGALGGQLALLMQDWRVSDCPDPRMRPSSVEVAVAAFVVF